MWGNFCTFRQKEIKKQALTLNSGPSNHEQLDRRANQWGRNVQIQRDKKKKSRLQLLFWSQWGPVNINLWGREEEESGLMPGEAAFTSKCIVGTGEIRLQPTGRSGFYFNTIFSCCCQFSVFCLDLQDGKSRQIKLVYCIWKSFHQ